MAVPVRPQTKFGVVVVVRLANSELALEDSDPVASGDYWRRIFENNPSFSSWHEAKQSEVKNEIVAKLRQGRVPLRVLDYGIGNMGLYRCLDGDLMDSLDLTGVSESQQHDADDELISRFRVNVVVGSGLSPLFAIPSGSKDRIISSYVFAYLDDSIRADLLREFARILAPTGELILVLHHPDGRRNWILKKSDPYWTSARRLYLQLLRGHHENAQVTLVALTRYLDEHFLKDIRHRNYLESYIRTAARFLEMFGANRNENVSIPDAAVGDCEDMIRLIDRECSMTCRSFRAIENPEREISLPTGLCLSRLAVCRDPADQVPIANVYCASKSSNQHSGSQPKKLFRSAG